jgi:hypothetical protein
MQLDIVVAFFILGALARAVKSNLQLPPALYQSLTIFLLIAIGLKGGTALSQHASPILLPQSLAVITLGIAIPLIAFPLLFRFGQLNRTDSASIAAHYGSVSVATYAVAVAVLESRGIAYEAYFPLFVVLLEMPAIAVGIAMARQGGEKVRWGPLLHEMTCNQGIVLMSGSLVIGYLAGEQVNSIMPLFGDLFHGVLALFLLEMGIVAASRISDIRLAAPFITAFAVLMPLVGAALGGGMAHLLGFTAGGIVLLATLGASASYIAVPAAMRTALPDANHGLSIAASLGVTFPFNVLVGIPLYLATVDWLSKTQ